MRDPMDDRRALKEAPKNARMPKLLNTELATGVYEQVEKFSPRGKLASHPETDVAVRQMIALS
jgi:hypothetical protein